MAANIRMRSTKGVGRGVQGDWRVCIISGRRTSERTVRTGQLMLNMETCRQVGRQGGEPFSIRADRSWSVEGWPSDKMSAV